MSGEEGKGNKGCAGAFWDGLEKGDTGGVHMLIDELVSFCNEEYQNSECSPCTAKITCEGICGEHCKECLYDIHLHEYQYRDEYDYERLLDYYVCH